MSTAVFASASALSVNGGTLQTFHYEVALQPQYTLPAACAFLGTLDDFNVIVGTEGPDELTGTNGRDLILGLGGNDEITTAGNQGDCVDGGEGNDRLYAGNSGDVLLGGAGEDHLYGGNGKDLLRGGPDNDVLHGGNGKDDLYGDAGSDDYCDGGNGDDYVDATCEHDGAPHSAAATGHHSIPTIDLTWQPAVEALYYNVYRSRTAAGPYAHIGSTDPTAYADIGVAEDTYYYYIVTAVIIEGLESEPSNQAQGFVASVAVPQSLQPVAGIPAPTATSIPTTTSTVRPTATLIPATATPTPTATPRPSSSLRALLPASPTPEGQPSP